MKYGIFKRKFNLQTIFSVQMSADIIRLVKWRRIMLEYFVHCQRQYSLHQSNIENGRIKGKTCSFFVEDANELTLIVIAINWVTNWFDLRVA